MALKLQWSIHANQQLQDLRDASETWRTISLRLGIGRSAVIKQARRIGIQPSPPMPVRLAIPAAMPHTRADRPCMPSGHPLSWAAITDGTMLEGEPYPFPVFL